MFPREQHGSIKMSKGLLSHDFAGSSPVFILLMFILMLVPFLVLIPGAWALAVWAARQRDAQSKLVERLTAGQDEHRSQSVENKL